MNKLIALDAFDILCGNKLGEGIHRAVHECRIRKEWVVKVEYEINFRAFANIHEMRIWCDNEYNKSIAKWLAPCHFMSPEGRILLQSKVRPINDHDKLPERLPAFLTDIKRENFGWLDDRLVCIDYSHVNTRSNNVLRKVSWD